LGDIGIVCRYLHLNLESQKHPEDQQMTSVRPTMTLASYLATIKTNRCGALPYAVRNGDLYYCLSRDKATEELGDLGGGVKRPECALEAGVRELNEESRGIFSHIYGSANDMSNKIAILDGLNMAMIFVPLESRWIEDAQPAFIGIRPLKKKSDEVSELVWVNENTFLGLINGKKSPQGILWTTIRSFLKKTYLPKMTEIRDALKTVATTVA
jgi:hypothetical protein